MKEVIIDRTNSSAVIECAVAEENDVPHIVFLLDKSGSMGAMLNETIENFNSFVDEQKELSDKAYMTLITFDSICHKVFTKKNVSQVDHLCRKIYRPLGCTALYDAIGSTIHDIKDKNVLMVILTDGQENDSKKYKDKKKLFKLREDKEKEGWKFLYLGVSEESINDASSIGIAKQDTITWNNNAAGNLDAFTSINAKSLLYRKNRRN